MKTLKKYHYACFLILYAVVYMLCFQYLEHRTGVIYHIIHCSLDQYIPFCEYFIIPYYLWFVYMFIMCFYFVIINREDRDCKNLLFTLCGGMTVFLIVSFFYPNGLQLRPVTMTNDSVFTKLVSFLYHADTATNVLPSIHVYNSITVYCAIKQCQRLKKYKKFRIFTLILTILIVLSTLFLKQHSIIDVSAGLLMAAFFQGCLYQKELYKNKNTVINQEISTYTKNF